MAEKPNLFQYATSELSQDAFLCWLIAWADASQVQHDKALNQCATRFVRALLGKGDDFEVKTIKVGKQWEKIDVWVEVNNQYFLGIEDKIGSSVHSNQLNRYKEIAKNYYKDKNYELKFIYFKMYEQADSSEVEQAEYLWFRRAQMLPILADYIKEVGENHANNILLDYYLKLKKLNEDINSYQTQPLTDWSWDAWHGFYATLQKDIGESNWNYVSNPSGGFLGFWWYWYGAEYNGTPYEYYLQLEQEEFTFKLCCENAESRAEIRDFYREKLFAKAQELGIEIYKAGRLGTYMSVAKLSSNYRKANPDGTLNMKETLKTLQQMQTLLDQVSQELS